jgi:molybdenum cofactor biosynthesis enzyme MoaA
MIDPFGRHITYLRVSVTDRCDFRCVYCMTEHMTFLPKPDLLTLEELERLSLRRSSPRASSVSASPAANRLSAAT